MRRRLEPAASSFQRRMSANRRKQMSITETEHTWPDDPEEKIKQAGDIARAVVEEYRDFLAEYHAQLVQPKIEIGKHGVAVEMPQSADHPQKVAELHRLRTACDNFVNAVSGKW
jgi:hypothetical protein